LQRRKMWKLKVCSALGSPGVSYLHCHRKGQWLFPSSTSSGTMSMWQDIFAVKIEKMHITDLWTLLKDDALQLQACRPGWKEFVHWSPLCLGRFQCSQCFHNWSSAKVHVLFHMYHCPGGGTVWMRIFRQKCRRCPNSRLEDPQFSLDTVETILHNLVIKILQYFYKKPVQPSDLLEVVVDTPVTGPHDRAHCEACELGICSRAPALDTCEPASPTVLLPTIRAEEPGAVFQFCAIGK
uniref:3CxxC-type domain-containing protein n=1 Tax=Serinus canaria TaxID=9135 RepID=A0A8C9NQP9_SERCA